MNWLKKSWAWVAGALVAIAGLVVAVLTLGKVRPKVLDRPKTPDVKIPDTKPVKTTVADDYARDKVRTVDDVAASIDGRYK